MITTVNYHLTKACNYKCKYCYATFNDISEKADSKFEQLKLIRLLAESKRFKKINFAGGEPTLVPHLIELIQYAKSLNFETSIVTNASRVGAEWIEKAAPYLDIFTISIDSSNFDTNSAIGRSQNNKIISIDTIVEIAEVCRLFDIKLKINTVVSQFNMNEILATLINQIKPFRWKILQATRVEGQNERTFDNLKVSSNQFSEYIEENMKMIDDGIKVIKESSELISGSYIMIDQLGRFFGSEDSKHNYSEKITTFGVEKCLSQINTDYSKFLKREGNYTTL